MVNASKIMRPPLQRRPSPHVRSAVAPLLILQAVFRPRNSFESRRLNVATAVQALAVRARFDPAQGVLDLEQRPRRNGAFLQGLGYALRGGGVIDGIPDLGFARSEERRVGKE